MKIEEERDRTVVRSPVSIPTTPLPVHRPTEGPPEVPSGSREEDGLGGEMGGFEEGQGGGGTLEVTATVFR